MTIENPLISIIIPVKNGDAWLEQTIPAIMNQSLFSQCEILVIDSGSTDNTLQLLKKFPVKVIEIAPDSFNHGTTRNLGVGIAKGKFVVMTVQDAKPHDDEWLASLLKGFTHDKVAGVCGQQIVLHNPENNPVQWFRPISKPALTEICFADFNEFLKLKPEEQMYYCRWDDVNAMYRRDVLLEIPFQKIDYAEDVLWARDAIKAGYCIVYNTAARVEHYHFETPDFTFKRNFTERYHFNLFFGIVPERESFGKQIIRFLRAVKLLWNEHKIKKSEIVYWLKYNYMIQKQISRSDSLFRRSHAKGNSELKNVYLKTCSSAPQATKSKV